jgi:hypothetical protein
MKLKAGNAKLARTIGVWNMTAGKDLCGRECPGCYAIKAQKRFPAVALSRQRNYEESLKPDFSINLTRNMKFVRVHEASDFYSQEYIDKWYEIAKSKPNIIFYAYTKRMLEFNFKKLLDLPNFVLHNSILPDGSYNYGKDTRKLQNKCTQSYVCPVTTGTARGCGYDCWWCMDKSNQGINILFKEH